MGSSDGRSKALRRLDERLSDVEASLARHEARLAELHEVKERLLAERAVLAEPGQGDQAAALAATAAGEAEPAAEATVGVTGAGRDRRVRAVGLPREAAPVGRQEEVGGRNRPALGPGPLDPEQIWQTFSSYQMRRGPRVLYGLAVEETRLGAGGLVARAGQEAPGAEPPQAVGLVEKTPPATAE